MRDSFRHTRAMGTHQANKLEYLLCVLLVDTDSKAHISVKILM